MTTITNILLLGFELYFAAVLGVAGLAKIKNPEQFAATLHRHRILPTWSIGGVSRIVPWLQIVVAVLLITGIAPIITALFVVVFFVSFLIIEAILIITKRATECGCYGVAYPQKVDAASIIASTVLLLTAILHLWMATWVEPASPFWRLPGILFFTAATCWLLLKVISTRRLRNQSVIHSQSA